MTCESSTCHTVTRPLPRPLTSSAKAHAEILMKGSLHTDELMAAVVARDVTEPEARLAVEYFVYRAAKEIGALAAVLGGVDGLVFTAGIGENSAEIRQRICVASAWLGVAVDVRA